MSKRIDNCRLQRRVTSFQAFRAGGLDLTIGLVAIVGWTDSSHVLDKMRTQIHEQYVKLIELRRKSRSYQPGGGTVIG